MKSQEQFWQALHMLIYSPSRIYQFSIHESEEKKTKFQVLFQILP